MITGTGNYLIGGNEGHLYEQIGIGNRLGMMPVIRVLDEIIRSNEIICTSFSNATLSTLITDVNDYLLNSSKEFIGIDFYTHSLLSVLYVAVVIERA